MGKLIEGAKNAGYAIAERLPIIKDRVRRPEPVVTSLIVFSSYGPGEWQKAYLHRAIPDDIARLRLVRGKGAIGTMMALIARWDEQIDWLSDSDQRLMQETKELKTFDIQHPYDRSKQELEPDDSPIPNRPLDAILTGDGRLFSRYKQQLYKGSEVDNSVIGPDILQRIYLNRMRDYYYGYSSPLMYNPNLNTVHFGDTDRLPELPEGFEY